MQLSQKLDIYKSIFSEQYNFKIENIGRQAILG